MKAYDALTSFYRIKKLFKLKDLSSDFEVLESYLEMHFFLEEEERKFLEGFAYKPRNTANLDDIGPLKIKDSMRHKVSEYYLEDGIPSSRPLDD
jgi:hypothetical protein